MTNHEHDAAGCLDCPCNASPMTDLRGCMCDAIAAHVDRRLASAHNALAAVREVAAARREGRL